ncbi:hypothetical protein [Rhodopseudomonas palustris]|uniref:Uncharacterized protein n=1 Tax=Rhodopseudomonas palustris (strain BisB18) TaxID=316056 RepID=Q21BR1_RHOPB
MATSDDGEEHLLVEAAYRECPTASEREASDKRDDADGNAHDEDIPQINPAVLIGVPPLPGLDAIEVVLIQPAPIWARWSEGLMIHVVGSGIVAVFAFVMGLMFAGTTNKAEGASAQPLSCVVAPVSAPGKKTE